MHDIFKKYSKHKFFSNVGLVVTSLIVALGVNFLLIDGTEMGQNFKANILGSNNIIEINSDVYFENTTDSNIVLKTSKEIKGVKSLSLSIVYNPENVALNNLNSNNNQITNIGNNDGIKSVIINMGEITNIGSGEEILGFEIQKKDNKTENLNIVNANFTDSSGEIYMLSTSGISF